MQPAFTDAQFKPREARPSQTKVVQGRDPVTHHHGPRLRPPAPPDPGLANRLAAAGGDARHAPLGCHADRGPPDAFRARRGASSDTRDAASDAGLAHHGAAPLGHQAVRKFRGAFTARPGVDLATTRRAVPRRTSPRALYSRRPQAPQAPEAPAQEAAGGARLSRSARPPGLDRRRCGADRALAAPRGGRRADADPHPPRGRHRDASFGGLRGRGRLGPLLLRGRRRAPVEPRELPVELMTTTAAPLTFCPFPKFHPPSLATHSVPASKISDCSIHSGSAL